MCFLTDLYPLPYVPILLGLGNCSLLECRAALDVLCQTALRFAGADSNRYKALVSYLNHQYLHNGVNPLQLPCTDLYNRKTVGEGGVVGVETLSRGLIKCFLDAVIHSVLWLSPVAYTAGWSNSERLVQGLTAEYQMLFWTFECKKIFVCNTNNKEIS